MMVYFRCPFV